MTERNTTSADKFVPRHLRPEVRAARFGACQFLKIANVHQGEHIRWRDCPNPIEMHTGVALCADHTRRIGNLAGMTTMEKAQSDLGITRTIADLDKEIGRLNGIIAWQRERLRKEADRELARTLRADQDADQVEMVYAVRVGFNIKVGHTTNLARRMRTGYSPSDQLLVAYPAPRSEELRIKRKFNTLPTHGREWLPWDPQVSEWVDSMVAKHGPPDPSITCGPPRNSALKGHTKAS